MNYPNRFNKMAQKLPSFTVVYMSEVPLITDSCSRVPFTTSGYYAESVLQQHVGVTLDNTSIKNHTPCAERDFLGFANTVHYRYNAADYTNILQLYNHWKWHPLVDIGTHSKRPMSRPNGRAMGCLL